MSRSLYLLKHIICIKDDNVDVNVYYRKSCARIKGLIKKEARNLSY